MRRLARGAVRGGPSLESTILEYVERHLPRL
jgi:hypothetical protein